MSSSSPWADLEAVFAKKERPCKICERTLLAVPVEARPIVERLLADVKIAPSTLARQIRDRGVPVSAESIINHRSHLEAA